MDDLIKKLFESNVPGAAEPRLFELSEILYFYFYVLQCRNIVK